MAGLGKGLAVIEAFGRDRPRLTVAEAARATGTTRATARRCLLTLEALGYLLHDGKYFHPTPRMLRLGASFLDTSPLPRLAQPHLEAARDELLESISLAVLEENWSVFVARAETQRIVSTGVRLGARLPAHASATGRVLLAALPDELVDSHLRHCRPRRETPKTLVARAEIRSRIVAARSEDMAYTDEELELGMRSMAVPVRDARGRTRAAMSASTFAARVTIEEMRAQFLPVLRTHAERLGRML
jgi:IclR family pca regulon transcriptional regulator